MSNTLRTCLRVFALPMAMLVGVLMLAAASIAESTDPKDFQGTWNTSVGDTVFVVVLRVDGVKVTGEYSTPFNPDWSGTIAGTVSQGGALNYTWNSAKLGKTGSGFWTVSTDGKLRGRYATNGSNEAGYWDGKLLTRTSEALPAPAAPPSSADRRDPMHFQGTWDTKAQSTDYFLVLRVNGTKVTGEYVAPGNPGLEGVVSGEVSRGILTYKWNSPKQGRTGSGEFRITTGGRLAGIYTTDGDSTENSWEGQLIDRHTRSLEVPR